MFIGHYGPALALKAVAPKTPVFALVAACQVMDYAWAGMILSGVEHASLAPGHLEGSALVLSHMPYSHSLLGASLISAAFAALVCVLIRQRSWAIFAAIFAAGVSHWLMDLIVHAPDLTLAGGPPYLGLGLWAYKWPSLALEAALAFGGLWLAVRATRPVGGFGRVTPWMMALAFLVFGAVNALQPTPDTIQTVAMSALAAYTVLVALGWAMDRSRAAKR